MKRKAIILVLLILTTGPLTRSQSGIVNHYLKVDSVLTDRVRVENTSELAYFQPGDKALLIQMKGANSGGNAYNNGEIGLTYSCGKFEILQVDEVTGTTEKYVIFTDDIDNTYYTDEKVQLIRILEGDKITILSSVTAKNWDGNTGGVLAMIGLDTIVLQGSIDVTGKGFRGGQPDESDYPLGSCLIYNAGDSINFPASRTGIAGYKGEGIIRTTWPYAKGAGYALNAGGGGQGLFSGGGGGSNLSQGGQGGFQSFTCGAQIGIQAEGGHRLFESKKFYQTDTRQIIMGGGGGSGTENKGSSHFATTGGNGGGIIMLITETFVGSGGVIRANGQDVTDTANASGGGGGAGGTVLIDAARYAGTFSVEISGGKGGYTWDNCTGAGGGGSGGVLWHSGTASSFPISATIDSSGGFKGLAYASCNWQNGWDGDDGYKLPSLLLPLNGFLFNTIRGKDTICAGQTPNLLTGSNPKGGNGIYFFAWFQSTDSIAWDSIANNRDYQPGPLTQTTWYRRTVRSEGIIDVSRPVKIFVYDVINGNTITANDTLCYNVTAKQLTGAAPSGGNGNYTYQWQASNNSISWNNISGATAASYNPGQLTATRYYRRISESAKVCSDTSQKITLTVIPAITSNAFLSPDTTICQNLSPGPLDAGTPANGDGSYRYLWQQKTLPGNWINIASSNIKQYNPGQLNDTMLYRRIVYSGNDDACIDTSPAKTVNVPPSLANNLISIDSVRWCAGNTPHQITGQPPVGGKSNEYIYQWQIRTTGLWTGISGANAIHLTPAVVEENTYYRRIVASAALKTANQYACHDTSAPLMLTVIPYINNQLDLPDQTLCQHNTPLPFNPSAAVTGGNDVFAYQWLAREEGSALWNHAPGASTAPDFTSGVLEETTTFARKVTSDICDDTSDIVTVTVYPIITGNSIIGSPVLYTCYNTSERIKASTPSDGSGTYAYLWQQWNGTSWEDAEGNTANDLADFESLALNDTMQYRRIVFSSENLQECKDTSNPVLIRINPLPAGDVETSFDTICGNTSANISFNVSGGNSPWKITVGGDGYPSFTKSGITITNDFIPLTFTNDQATYAIKMIEIEDDSTCKADLADFINESVVVVYAVPVAEAGETDSVCGNQYGDLSADPPLSSHIGQWSLAGGTFADPSDPSTLVTIDEDHYGEQYLKWTVTNWHCPNSDSVLIIFYEQPVNINAGEDQTLEFLYSTQLEADPPEVGTGTWKVVEGTGILSDENAPDATVTELADDNLIRWTIINGVCPEIKDSVNITVNRLVPQKGFTPNGDNINDEFVIPTQNAEKIEIKVFNRAGVLVWESDDYTQGKLWGGQFKGTNVDLPEGTYFYWMKIWVKGKSQPIEYKQFVEILR